MPMHHMAVQAAAAGLLCPHTFPSRFFFLNRLAWDLETPLSCSSVSPALGCVCAVAPCVPASVTVI